MDGHIARYAACALFALSALCAPASRAEDADHSWSPVHTPPYDPTLFQSDAQRAAFHTLAAEHLSFLTGHMCFFRPIPTRDPFLTRAYEISPHPRTQKPTVLLAFDSDIIYLLFYDHRPTDFPALRFFQNEPTFQELPSTFYPYIAMHSDAVLVRHPTPRPPTLPAAQKTPRVDASPDEPKITAPPGSATPSVH